MGRQEITDADNTFSLPQKIRVIVSNCQLENLHKILAIFDSEYLYHKIQKDEQFSPTVTVVDTKTQQALDCVLLLHGEKLPRS